MADDGVELMFENRVRELREDRLMTQSELADKANLALRTVLSIEKGMECRMDTKRKILRAFRISLVDKELVFPARRLRDLTTNELVFRSAASGPSDRIGLTSVESYSSQEGFPIYRDHDYELSSVYQNTSNESQDSMAVMFFYVLDKDFRLPPKMAAQHEN